MRVSPRFRVQSVVIMVLLFWLWSDGVQAQTTSFNYQGRLVDGGSAANGVYDLQFQLFDALTGGNQVGAGVLRNDVAVTNGIFNVTVDFGVSAFPGANRWLEISVRLGASTGSYTALAPLQSIVSAPYAVQSLKAANATQLGGVNSDQYVLTTDSRLSDVNCASPCLSSSEIVDGTIVNADISASAAIAPSKISGTAATLGANSFGATQTIDSGNLALTNSVDANTGVLMLGGSPFLHNFGPYNTFVGQDAGNFTMTGVGINTAIGSLAFSSNTTGISNTAIGSESLAANTTGNNNAAMGRRALYSNTVGFGNTANGAHSLYSNLTGTYNTASGHDALRNNNGGSNTATGATSLYSNTTGFLNTASGYDTLRNNTTGSGNTAGGVSSLFSNTTGTYNTALGLYAGDPGDPAHANTTGSYNTFIGTQSGPGTPTQLNNATAIGANARVSASNALVLGDSAVSVGIGTSSPTAKLDVNGTVKATAFVGDGSALTNLASAAITDGAVTSAKIADGTIADIDIHASAAILPTKIAGTAATLGANSFNATQTITSGNLDLTNSTSSSTGVITSGGVRFLYRFGSQNTFLGLESGNFTTTGGQNTAIGDQALSTVTSGSGNAASGFRALASNTTGTGNTADGFAALYSNTTGAYNTAVGNAAGVTEVFSTANKTGSYNTFIGYQTGLGTSTQVANSTAIGANARVSVSNAMVLGDSNVSVGIGTTTPAAKLDVSESNGHFLVGSGGCGGSYMAIGFASTLSNCTNYSLLGEGTNTYINRPSGGSIVFRENNTSSPNQMTIATGGNVGIGTNTPDSLLTVSGTASKLGGGSWSTFSDRRLKNVDGDFQAGLTEVLQLQPVRYHYKQQNAMGIADHQEHIGFVAQEVEKVIPEAVTRNDQGYLLVNNDPILWAMLNAIKQQQHEIRTLRTELEATQTHVHSPADDEMRQLRRELEELRALFIQDAKSR